MHLTFSSETWYYECSACKAKPQLSRADAIKCPDCGKHKLRRTGRLFVSMLDVEVTHSKAASPKRGRPKKGE